MKPPDSREIRRVLGETPVVKVEYVAKRVADRGEVWGLLRGDAWVMMGTDEDGVWWPVWSMREYAELCAVDGWADCVAERMTVEEWLEASERAAGERGVGVAVLPGPDGKGKVTMGIASFNAAVRYELSRFE